MNWLDKVLDRIFPKGEEIPHVGFRPTMTLEVSFPVIDVWKTRENDTIADVFRRAERDKERARSVFLAIAAGRQVTVHAIDFVEFDSSNVGHANAYFAVDYSGEKIDAEA